MEEEIKKLREEIEYIDSSDISSLLYFFREISNYKYDLSQLDQLIKDKVRVYMKERKWKRLVDRESKVSVSISTISRKKYDERELGRILTKSQLALVIIHQEVERMDIVTPESKKRMGKFVRGN